MSWEEGSSAGMFTGAKGGLFSVHGDLDGEKVSEFQEREQFIGLCIGTEEFFLPIAAVHEIIMLPPITYVPNSSEFIDGVINLRGTILPALNMRKMMGFERGEKTANARIIIGRFQGITFGMIVDGITYVVSLLPTEIEVQSLPGKGTGAEFIGGLSKQGAKICGILDLVRVLKHVAGNLDNEDVTEGEVEGLD